MRNIHAKVMKGEHKRHKAIVKRNKKRATQKYVNTLKAKLSRANAQNVAVRIANQRANRIAQSKVYKATQHKIAKMRGEYRDAHIKLNRSHQSEKTRIDRHHFRQIQVINKSHQKKKQNASRNLSVIKAIYKGYILSAEKRALANYNNQKKRLIASHRKHYTHLAHLRRKMQQQINQKEAALTEIFNQHKIGSHKMNNQMRSFKDRFNNHYINQMRDINALNKFMKNSRNKIMRRRA